MPRIGNITVFEETINGNGTFTSDPKFNELIGRADSLSVQTFASNTGGTTPSLSCSYWGSNDGKSWNSKQVIENAASIAAPPYENEVTTDPETFVNSAQGRFQLSLGGTDPYAYVRITVCLRTD